MESERREQRRKRGTGCYVLTQPEARADWQLPHDSLKKTDLLLLYVLYTIYSIADGVGGGMSL